MFMFAGSELIKIRRYAQVQNDDVFYALLTFRYIQY